MAYPATGNTTHLVVEDLMENTFYSLYVVASNQFGEGNKSATLEIGKYPIICNAGLGPWGSLVPSLHDHMQSLDSRLALGQALGMGSPRP